MKRLLPVLLLCSLLFVGCEFFRSIVEDTETDDEFDTTDTVELVDNAVIIDTSSLMTLTIRDTTAGVMHFSNAEYMRAGDVVVSAKDGGYLIIVDSLVSTGTETKVWYTQAGLTDIIENCNISTTFSLADSNASQARAEWAPDAMSYSFDSSGYSFIKNSYLDVGIDAGTFTFAPKITIELKIEGRSLEHFKVTADGSLDYSMGFHAEAKAAYESDSSKTLWSRDFTHTYWIPTPAWGIPFPLVVGIGTKINAGYDFNGEIEGRIFAGVQYNKNISFGAGYVNGGFTKFASTDHQFNMKTPYEYTLSGEATLDVYIEPEISLELYKISGPTIDFRPYVELNATVDDSLNGEWQLNGGILSTASMELSVFDRFELGTPSLTLLSWRTQTPITRGKFSLLGYTGTVIGRVKNASTSEVISGVTATITGAGGVSAGQVVTDSLGGYSLALNPGTYSIQLSKAGFRSSTINNIVIVANQETIAPQSLQIDESYVGNGTITGQILNASTSTPVPGATISFREGINEKSGTIISTVTADASGMYTASIPTGNYTAEAKATDFISNFLDVTSLGGETTSNMNLTITSRDDAGLWRIVLNWGTNLPDLDAHLTGPTTSADRFHVYYNNSQQDTSVALDVDDTDYEGPETITITSQDSGTYRYSVHDFTNRDSTSSVALTNSGAKVDVYFSGQLQNAFIVPPGSGTLWTVFEINGGTITPVNSLSYESDDANVRAVRNDAQLIADIPLK